MNTLCISASSLLIFSLFFASAHIKDMIYITQVFVPVSTTPEVESDSRSKETITVSIGSAIITVKDGFTPELFRSVY